MRVSGAAVLGCLLLAITAVDAFAGHDAVLPQLRSRACAALAHHALHCVDGSIVTPPRIAAAAAADPSDGALVDRARIAENDTVALDVISYMSDGLIVGGLLCQGRDAGRRSTVIHVPGGVGGVFEAAAGDLVQACIDWAALHGRTAFAPSLRGQDGGQGRTELCLGEADDVVAAAIMLRGLEVVDASRMALVGGSIGGCVALRAAPRIPNLAAVVAFVPPLSWKDLVHYHRTAWQPDSETACDGSQQPRALGGPAFADAFDSVICGHAECSDAEYESRSPLPYIGVQSAPTLIVAAERDNIVPPDQQVLWSVFRQGTGHPVSVVSVDKCDAPGTPAPSMDGLVLARGAFHLLPSGPVSSGMLFLMQALDAIPPAPAARSGFSPEGAWRP
jgi:dipeptidyl aminopeptidase/acylaminoacyl peptidase